MYGSKLHTNYDNVNIIPHPNILELNLMNHSSPKFLSAPTILQSTFPGPFSKFHPYLTHPTLDLPAEILATLRTKPP